jgi:magnesium chelatase family protein
MSLAVVLSRATVGIDAPAVSVEIHLANGLPAFSIVGLPEAAVRESKDRVRGAVLTCGFEFPQRRITVNLAPADLPKVGGGFDLPIALGILLASGQLKAEIEGYEFCGELSLNGSLRSVGGVLAMAVQARRAGNRLIVPAANAPEGALVHPQGVLGAEHLLAVAAHLSAAQPLTAAVAAKVAPAEAPDLMEVRGQQAAKRALEIAAAGGHKPALDRPAGHRQEHAGCPLSRNPAAHERGRGAGDGGGGLGERSGL